LYERLNRRLAILATGDHTAPPRHQTMRALIDWSYDLLTPPEQRLFERLSIFAGGCTLAAAANVYADAAVDDLGVLELLSSLFDKSLVVADFEGREPRYSLLESFRQYGREKLATRGENFGDAAITIAGVESDSQESVCAQPTARSWQVDTGDMERRARRLRGCISSRPRSFRKTQICNRTDPKTNTYTVYAPSSTAQSRRQKANQEAQAHVARLNAGMKPMCKSAADAAGAKLAAGETSPVPVP
jgi:hypothetical protein